MEQAVQRKVSSHSPADTCRVAAELAAALGGGAVLALHGELGAGKTCFVQGLAAALGVKQAVNSPTFMIINEHKGRCPLHHIDLYRISGPDEALALGLDEYLHGDGITAIEWAEKVEGLLPEATIHIDFELGATPDERVITIRGHERDARATTART